MRVRRLISERKSPSGESGDWSTNDLPPRWCSIYERSRTTRAGWQWRSLRARANGRDYLAVAQCNPRRDNWKSVLILETDAGPSVVARFEYHGSHPGNHVHSNCATSGLEVGVVGMDNLGRIPSIKNHHRRTEAFTPSSFWRATRDFFRIETPSGEQSELF